MSTNSIEYRKHINKKPSSALAVLMAAAALAGCGKNEDQPQAQASPQAIENIPTPTQVNEAPVEASLAESGANSLAPDATSVEVATAFIRAFAEADPQTGCALDWDDYCDPADSADLPPMPEFTPTGAKEVLNNPPYSVVEVSMQLGKACITLIRLDEGWRVKEYTTPPATEEC